MPRKHTIHTNIYPYHITIRSNHKEWFQLEMSHVWRIAIKTLKQAHEKHPVVVHAFVLMSNHYHLVIATPSSQVDKFMYEFNKLFSLRLRQATGLINRMFGGRYKWSVITDRVHYSHVLKYVLLNPVRAGIVKSAEEYPFSTLGALSFPAPVRPYIDVKSDDFIGWLRLQHSESQRESLKRGLTRTKFKPAGSREVRKPPEFDQFF